MDSNIAVRILQLACLAVLFLSLYFRNDLLLVLAAVMMVVCIVISFYIVRKRK